MKEKNPKLTFPLKTLIQGRIKETWMLIFAFLHLNNFGLLSKM